MQDQVAETVAEKLLDYVCKFGIPDEILTDRGTNFMSELLQEVYDLLDILRLRTSPFWPERNGLSEENVKTMKNMINAFITVTQNTWDQHINELCFAFNTAEHCSTKFTPFEVQFARTPKLPIDLFYNTDDNEDTVTIDLNLRVEEYADRTQNKLKKLFKLVKNNQELKMNKAKLRYDRNVRAAKVKEGDLVLILDQGPKKGLNKKLMPRWKGPYRVLQVISETNYKIQTINTLRKRTFVVHRNKIKRYHGNATVTEIPIETRKKKNKTQIPENLNSSEGNELVQSQTVQGQSSTVDLDINHTQTPRTVTQEKEDEFEPNNYYRKQIQSTETQQRRSARTKNPIERYGIK